MGMHTIESLMHRDQQTKNTLKGLTYLISNTRLGVKKGSLQLLKRFPLLRLGKTKLRMSS